MVLCEDMVAFLFGSLGESIVGDGLFSQDISLLNAFVIIIFAAEVTQPAVFMRSDGYHLYGLILPATEGEIKAQAVLEAKVVEMSSFYKLKMISVALCYLL